MRNKNQRGVSEVRLKKTRLLHLGNVEKLPHPQLSAQRACDGSNPSDIDLYKNDFIINYKVRFLNLDHNLIYLYIRKYIITKFSPEMCFIIVLNSCNF